MRSAEEIHALYLARKARLDALHCRMMEVRDTVNGDVVLPLPELDTAERPAVANLVLMGVEQKALRVASTTPSILCPPLRPGIKRSEEAARTRSAVLTHWWDRNRMRRLLQRRARHVVGYGMSPVLVRPDFAKGYPCWGVRDPITTLPPDMDDAEIVPDDCIFSYTRPLSWIRRNYPGGYAALNKPRNGNADAHYRMLEYVDADCYVLICVGEMPNQAYAPDSGYTHAGHLVTVEAIPNRVGRPLAVVPGRIGLDRMAGEFDGVLGFYQSQAKLFALEEIGMHRAVWPETWLVARPGERAQIVSQADPLSGEIGRIEGGDLTTIAPTPSPFGLNIVDRLERAQRIQAGIPAEFGGESTSNIRTGRRGDAVLAATIDFPIQAAQELLAMSLEEENRVAIAIDKLLNRRASYYMSATKGYGSYDPGQTWETDDNHVAYSHAGMDQSGLVISAGQRMGMGTMSKRSFMEIDPLVEDVESEADRIIAESLEAAALSAISSQAAADPSFLPVLAKLIARVRTNRDDLIDGFLALQTEMQADQAAAAQGELDEVGSQPGLAQPDLAAIGPPPQASTNLRDLLMTLRQTAGAAAPIGGEG